MIRIKFGPHESTFFKVFQVYKIVELFHRRVCMKYIFHLFISFYFTCWQYRIKSRVVKYVYFSYLFRKGNIEGSFEQAKSFCQVLVLDG